MRLMAVTIIVASWFAGIAAAQVGDHTSQQSAPAVDPPGIQLFPAGP